MIHFTDTMRVFLTYCKNKKMGLYFILFKIFFIVKKKKVIRWSC